jgi:GPH family glycoside/pentoside/hexuronide:cation symporter
MNGNESVSGQKLSVLEKVGYSLGDLAANLIFQTLVTFLAFFYTDVFGIPARTASFIMFVAGMVSAFAFTPIMGLIADRTQTRWGKFRPWILWTAVPFGGIALLAFSTPDLSPGAKVAYAWITYLLLLAVYAANNLPYAALSGVLTGSMKERNSMSAYRFVAVMVAQFIIQVLLLPLVLMLGDGDKTVGFHKAMILFASMGIVFFIITFLSTRERIVPIVEKRASVAQDLRDLTRNLPWLITLIVTVMYFITLALKGGAYIYYFENYLDEGAVATFLMNLGFRDFIDGLNSLFVSLGLSGFYWPEDATTSAFSLFNACSIIMQIVGIGFSKFIADRFGKRNTFGLALFISTLFLLVFYWIPPDAIALVYLANIGHGLAFGITVPILWAMVADVADYSEWRNNRRATAIIFSAMMVGLKAGLSLGGALLAAILAYYGYDASLPVQSEDTILGIKASISIYAAIPFFAATALLVFYVIGKDMENRIESELQQRREGAEEALRQSAGA